MQFFRVKKFEQFQHYKDRRPPWIKLYRDLLRDPRFFCLTDGERYHLIGLFIIASQNDNQIPNDQAWLRHELGTTKPIVLQRLIDTGWLEYVGRDASEVLAASFPLAERKQEPIVETETEIQRQNTETEEEKKPQTFRVVEADFQSLWQKYPNPRFRKDSLRHFNATVKTEVDLANIHSALENYKAQRLNENARRKERGSDEIAWQNGSTWFNNWQDWVPEDFEQPDDAHPQHRCNFCDVDPHVWLCEDSDCTLDESVACPQFRARHQERMAVKT